MAETRRNFRSNDRKEEPKEERTTAAKPKYDKGGDGGEFIPISSFFPSKSGKASTFFVKAEMLEKFADLREGDIVGISENQKSGRMMLWYLRKS